MEADILKKKLDILLENILKNQWQYFHKRSVTNFILNIELIKEEEERKNTLKYLLNASMMLN